MDDGVGAVDQLLERLAGAEVAHDPVDAVALRLGAAGEGDDAVSGGKRGIEQMRADEAGAAGEGYLHLGSLTLPAS